MQHKKTARLCAAVAAFCVFAAGCGARQTSPSPSAGSSAALPQVSGASKDTLVWVTALNNERLPNDPAVAQRLNELLAKKGFSLKVEFSYALSFSDADGNLSKINAMKSAGQQADLVYSGGLLWDKKIYPYYNFVKSGIYAPIDDYLSAEPGQKLFKALDAKYWTATAIGGRHYGVPLQQFIALPAFVEYNKDLAKKYGIDPSKFTNDFQSLEGALKTVCAGEKGNPNFTGLMAQELSPDSLSKYDMITNAVGVELTDRSARAVNIYRTPYIQKTLETLRRYRTLGYISSGPNTVEFFVWPQEGYVDESITATRDGITPDKDFLTGLQQTGPAYTFSDQIQGLVNGIASWSTHKDEAYALLSMVNTDPEIANLLAYGIEGTNYKLSNGKVVPDEKHPYNTANCCIYGNNVILHDLSYSIFPNAKIAERNKEALVSPVFGFYFDEASVKKEVDATQAAVQKYSDMLWDGSCEDADATLAKLNSELDAAGMDKLLKEINRQIAAWKK